MLELANTPIRSMATASCLPLAEANVLLLLESDGLGGVERVTMRLAHVMSMANACLTPALFVASEPTGLSLLPDVAHIHGPWRFAQGERMIGALPRLVPLLRRTVAAMAPEAVVIAATPNLMACALLAGLGSRTVYWLHGQYGAGLQDLGHLVRIAQEVAIRRARYLVSLDDTLLARVPVSPTHRLRAAIANPFVPPAPGDYEPSALANQAAFEKVRSRRAPVVLFLGRLDRQKHAEVMLALAKRRLDCELVIVGDGPERARLERAARNHPNVTVAGAEPNPVPWLAMASTLVLASEYEAWPTVVAEAFWEGVPVVTTRCSPVLPKLFAGEFAAFLVDRHSDLPSALDRALHPEARRLFAREARARLGDTNPQFVLQRWETLLGRVRAMARKENPRLKPRE